MSPTTVFCVSSLQTSKCSDMLSCHLHSVTLQAHQHSSAGPNGAPQKDMLQVLLPGLHEDKVY